MNTSYAGGTTRSTGANRKTTPLQENLKEGIDERVDPFVTG
jgi:hypothetical protein